MPKEIILPVDTLVVEDEIIRLTKCTYKDGSVTSEVSFFDDPNNCGAANFNALAVWDPSSGVIDDAVFNRYPYTRRLSEFVVARLAESNLQF